MRTKIWSENLKKKVEKENQFYLASFRSEVSKKKMNWEVSHLTDREPSQTQVYLHSAPSIVICLKVARFSALFCIYFLSESKFNKEFKKQMNSKHLFFLNYVIFWPWQKFFAKTTQKRSKNDKKNDPKTIQNDPKTIKKMIPKRSKNGPKML